MSYSAIIAPLSNVRKHPNADKLNIATVAGSTVIVGLDNIEGERGIFFPDGGQLSPAFCTEHDLISRKDANGNKVGGFFSDKRRVRVMGLRGVKSEGFWMPLGALQYTDVNLNTLKDGDEVTTLNGHLICEKYISPATKRAMAQAQGKKEVRGATKFFPKHFDTTQFRFVKDFIFASGGVVYITAKLHGTSQRTGNVLDTVELPWWKQLVNNIVKDDVFPKRQYKIIHGTRNVILDDAKPGWYGTNDFRRAVAAPWEGQLHKGEMVFYEIVGDVSEGCPIMPPIAIGDKELKKQYGSHMNWRYGCAPGEARVFVYRITRTNEDGVVTELSWPQVEQRSRELDLATVPALHIDAFDGTDEDTQNLQTLVAQLTEGPDPIDPTHMREGVVIRVENEFGTQWAKNKSFSFLHLEQETNENPDYVDTEETA